MAIVSDRSKSRCRRFTGSECAKNNVSGKMRDVPIVVHHRGELLLKLKIKRATAHRCQCVRQTKTCALLKSNGIVPARRGERLIPDKGGPSSLRWRARRMEFARKKVIHECKEMAGGRSFWKKSGLRHRENDTTRQLIGNQNDHILMPKPEIQSAPRSGKADVEFAA